MDKKKNKETGKKSSKKGGKKKEEDKREEIQENITVLDKQYYLTQIQSLERTIERTTLRCEQLTEAEKNAREKFLKLHKEKTEISAYFRDRLSTLESENEELRNRLNGIKIFLDEQTTNSQRRENELKKELETTTCRLNNENLVLTRKLEGLEDFRVMRDELYSELKELKNTLEKERKENEETVANLEKRCILQKENLQKEQEEKLATLSKQLRKRALDEVHTTTRTALQENAAHSKTIQVMQKKMVVISKENSELRKKVEHLKMRISVLNDSFTEASNLAERRSNALRIVVEKAAENSQTIKEFEKLQEENRNVKRTLQQLQFQIDASTKLSCELRENSSEKTIALDLISAKLSEERLERKKVTEVLHRALKLIQSNIFENNEWENDMSAKEVDKESLQMVGSIFEENVTDSFEASERKLEASHQMFEATDKEVKGDLRLDEKTCQPKLEKVKTIKETSTSFDSEKMVLNTQKIITKTLNNRKTESFVHSPRIGTISRPKTQNQTPKRDVAKLDLNERTTGILKELVEVLSEVEYADFRPNNEEKSMDFNHKVLSPTIAKYNVGDLGFLSASGK